MHMYMKTFLKVMGNFLSFMEVSLLCILVNKAFFLPFLSLLSCLSPLVVTSRHDNDFAGNVQTCLSPLLSD